MLPQQPWQHYFYNEKNQAPHNFFKKNDSSFFSEKNQAPHCFFKNKMKCLIFVSKQKSNASYFFKKKSAFFF